MAPSPSFTPGIVPSRDPFFFSPENKSPVFCLSDVSTLKLLPPYRLHICPIFSTSTELPFSQYLMHCLLQEGNELFSAHVPADSGLNTWVSKGSSHFCICFAVFTFLLQSVSLLFPLSLSVYIFRKTKPPKASCHFSGVSGECLFICFLAVPGLTCGTGHLFVEACKLSCGVWDILP